MSFLIGKFKEYFYKFDIFFLVTCLQKRQFYSSAQMLSGASKEYILKANLTCKPCFAAS